MTLTRPCFMTASALAFTFVSAAPLLRAAPPEPTGTYVIDKVHSEMGFQVRHLVTKVRGRFDDFAGTIDINGAKPEASKVELTIRTASVNTEVPDRDKDLRSLNFFDVEKYPEIRFVSTKIAPAGPNTYNVTGNLTLHGATREITLPVTFLGVLKSPWGDTRAGFELTTTLNRKDYGMNFNKALDQGGYLLGDDVAISISLETVLRKPAAPAAK